MIDFLISQIVQQYLTIITLIQVLSFVPGTGTSLFDRELALLHARHLMENCRYDGINLWFQFLYENTNIVVVKI